MKKLTIKRVILLACIFCVMQNMQGECYVLNDATTRKLSLWSSYEYAILGPANKLSFTAKKSSEIALNAGLKIEQNINGSWSEVDNISISSTSGESHEFSLNQNATAVKFSHVSPGSFSKYIWNVKVTRAKFITSSASQLSYGTLKVEQELEKETTITYSNVGNATLQLNANTSGYFSITQGGTQGATCSATQTVKIKYAPLLAGTHTAVLNVSDGVSSVAVPLKGSCIKYVQTIDWHISSMLSSKTEHTDIAVASSGLPLEYVSSNPDVVAVENGVLKAKSAGEATITATQLGTYYWEAVSSTKTITVVDKEVQTITWEQDLFRLTENSSPVTLTAVASSGLPVHYESTNTAVVSVSGNILTVVGLGTASVIAYQDGDNTYCATTAMKAVRVRQVTSECDEFALYSNESLPVMTVASQKVDQTLDLTAPADKMSFTVKRDGWATGYVYVYEVDANNNETEIYSAYVGNPSPLDGSLTFENIQISLAAQKIRFKSSGTLWKDITSVYVTQASYLTTSVPNIIFNQTVVGELVTASVTFNYSNLNDEIQLTHNNPKFTLNKDYFGNGCGDFGSTSLNITYSSDVVATDKDTIALICAGVTKLFIPMEAVCGKKSQTITWNQNLENLIVGQQVALTATATSGLPVNYSVNDSSLATIEDGILRVLAAGDVTITASQDGNANYNAASSVLQTVIFGAAINFVVDGDTTINDNVFYTTVTIKPGKTLTIALSGNLTTNQMTFEVMNGIIGALDWEGTINAQNWTFHKIITNEDVYHHLSLPFDYPVRDIQSNVPAERWRYGIDWLVREYDGSIRAEKGANQGAWTKMSIDSTLRSGRAYLIGVSEDVDLSFVSTSVNKIMPVTVKPHPSARSVNAGWNYISTGNWNEFQGSVKLSNNENLNYVYLSNDNARTYTAYEMSEVCISPFTGMFVQIPDTVNGISFEQQQQKAMAPKVKLGGQTCKVKVSLENTTCGTDVAALIVNDDETTDYRINHDLAKMLSLSTRPQIYSLGAETKLAYNALPFDAAKNVVLGCYFPENGSYTIKQVSLSGDILSLELTDTQTGIITDLLAHEYTFEAAQGTNEGRFVISVNKNANISTAVSQSKISGVSFCSENGKLVVSGLPTGAEYVLFDVVGRVLEKGVSESDVLLFHPEMRGVYAVRVVVDGVAEVLKTIF